MRTPLRLVPILLAVAAVVAACGVSPESEPQAIDADDVPFSLLDPQLSTTTTEPATGATEPFTFYLLRSTEEGGTLLVETQREVPIDPTPAEVVAALLQLQPTEEEEAEGLGTRIPEDTELLSDPTLDQAQSVLILDFNENLTTVTGDGQRALFAQIVCTLTELEGVSRVRFRVEGDDIAVLNGESESVDGPIDCAAYSNFQPTS